MALENRTDREVVAEARQLSDDNFMKKNNITRQNYEQRDMGLDIGDNTYVTVWVEN